MAGPSLDSVGSPGRGVAGATIRPRFFCFPYAGGSEATFGPWFRSLSNIGDVRAVSLRACGHSADASRAREWRQLTESLLGTLEPELSGPFAFFGHSLGALVAFELARMLRRSGRSQPRHLFVAAMSAPQLERKFDPPLSGQSDDHLLQRLFAAGGVPREVLRSHRLIRRMLPRMLAMLREDLRLLESYSYTADLPLECPITAIGGSDDPFVEPDDLRAWSAQTASAFHVEILKGDHFLIDKRQDQLLRRMSTVAGNLQEKGFAP